MAAGNKVQNMETRNGTHTLRQEMVNTITHGLGVLFGLTCMPILINAAYSNSDTYGLIGTSIYGFCFIMLFTSSTLYHYAQQQRLKRLLEIWDHISIYFLISGTYTPFLLIYMKNDMGFLLLTVLWVLTALGIIFKIYFTGRLTYLSVFVYFLMGWILVFAGRSFFENMSLPVVILVIAGGALYSIGIIFYLWDKYTFSHAVWHFFVLAAAICHYAAIMLSI